MGVANSDSVFMGIRGFECEGSGTVLLGLQASPKKPPRQDVPPQSEGTCFATARNDPFPYTKQNKKRDRKSIHSMRHRFKKKRVTF